MWTEPSYVLILTPPAKLARSPASTPACCVRSGEHCKICSGSDEDRDVYLYDLSCNGTYVNGKLVGKDSRQLLKAGDTVTLLDPAKPNHYQFIFQDLRPALPPPAPVQLLQNTSLMAILGLVELLGISRSLLANPAFIGRYLEVYLWLAAVYWLACTAMALLARHLEVQLDPVRSNR